MEEGQGAHEASRRGALGAEKALAAERTLVRLRLLVVVTGSVLYVLMDKTGTVPVLAYTLLAGGWLYALAILIGKPHERLPAMLSGVLTAVLDALITMLWLYATGGYDSPFFVIIYPEIIAIAFRFPARTTYLASIAFAGSYVLMLALIDQLEPHGTDALVRVTYVFLSALLGSTMFREVQALTAASLGLSRRLAAIVESSGDAILSRGVEGRIVTWNQAAESMYGYTAAEALGQQIGMIVPPDLVEEERGLFDRVCKGELIADYQTRRRTKDGRTIDVALTLSPVRDADDRVVLVAGVGRDITERKRVEQERERLVRELGARHAQLEAAVNEREAAVRARNDFLSAAAHELRTPMTALQLQTEMLRMDLDGGPAPPARDKLEARVQSVAGQIQRLGKLIENLLDVSRITAGGLALEIEDVDLAALIRDVIARHEEEARRSGSAFAIRAAGPIVGRWDRLRLDQVVTNLIANALKYGAGKPIEVAVERSGAVARIRVRDQGIGIAPEDQKRIFERFERVVSEKQYQGLGLGLWIVRQIVEALGGTIAVTSEPGRGSTFQVELPLGAAAEAQRRHVSAS